LRARSINPGDVVLVSRKGRLFHAKVKGLDATGGFAVEPIERNISYRHAAAREIVDHWAHTVEARPKGPPDGQLPLDDLFDD
jgi:hypothetical protein